MSFDYFKKHLNKLLVHPQLIKSDWEIGGEFPPHEPTIQKWTSSDTEDLFNSILNNSFNQNEKLKFLKIDKKRLELSLNFYINNPIQYNLNEYRFRSDTFSINIDGNLFLGCSDTFGIGHNLEHTWPHILTQLRFPNDRIYNLGTPGGGSDTNFRHLTILKDNIKIKNIFHWLPFRNRFEYFLGSDDFRKPDKFLHINKTIKPVGFNVIAPQYETNYDIFSEFYIKNGLTTHTARNINILKNISAIKEISNELGVPYYLSNFEIGSHKETHLKEVLNYIDKNNIPRNLLARDFTHGSVYDNIKIVANFLNLIDALKII